ncbi:MAG: hypothetical protein N2Z85_02660 [Patescibacteria group bacterium]|nr:hypothetical protein [Patescibacteria group bacterium]
MKDFLKKIVLIIRKEVNNMKKTILTTGVLTLIFGVLLSSKTLAYRGDPNVRGPNCTDSQYQEVQNAIEKKDYNTWKKLMGDKGIARKINNQDEFNKFIQMRNYMLQKKYDEANKIKTELGLGGGIRKGFGYNRK